MSDLAAAVSTTRLRRAAGQATPPTCPSECHSAEVHGLSVGQDTENSTNGRAGSVLPEASSSGTLTAKNPTGSDTTGGRPIYNGGQMYDGTQYDWSAVYADGLTRNTMYIEVYTSSFISDSNGNLASTVKDFAATFNGMCANPR